MDSLFEHNATPVKDKIAPTYLFTLSINKILKN